MPVADQLVSALHDKCGLSTDECRVALKQRGGEVDVALADLIDAGRVGTDQLNPDTVSDELFTRAVRQQKLEMYRQLVRDLVKPGASLASLTGGPDDSKALGGALKKLADQAHQLKMALYGNKTPEQLLAEDEEKQAARLKKLYEETGHMPMTPGQQARMSALTKRRSAWIDAHPYTLDLPPFPPLVREFAEWTGRDVLAAWAGTQDRQGGYTSVSGDRPSDGSFALEIPRLGEDDANPRPPAPEQLAAYAFLKEHQADVTETILAALVNGYAVLRPQWLEQDQDLEMPDIRSVDEMRQNVGLGTLHMFEFAKEGCAYFGLELGCTWDEEHAAGVILHRGRIVALGPADTSFDRHPAIADGGVQLQ